MKQINVNLGDRTYSIKVGSGLLGHLTGHFSELNHGQKWVIISQQSLIDQYGSILIGSLAENGFDCDIIEIKAGEKAKSFSEYQKVVSRMMDINCDRSSTIIAFGGGVTCDLAGFVASTFMRGIDYFHIPTTLLAMVDASIGGKTGLNLNTGKNLVGTIYQPKEVFIDPDLLSTLPKEEIVAGLGEVLKYGAIWDREFFIEIGNSLDNLDQIDFESAIVKSCEIKAEIVSKDEFEGGLRRILNFGHTIGHGIEAHLGYGTIRHGEAVAYGMICAGLISNKIGLMSDDDQFVLKKSILKLPLPELPNLDVELILLFIRSDKKTISGRLHFVVLNGLGCATISDEITESHIVSALRKIQ
jgi:3-dehydroquinate synthase|tara:strand:+ start:13182 stop:14252 length:1071 start_codon:yes stop_codon:yes gene_type:complete